MGWFRRRRDDTTPGYEDNAALSGFGGYQPSDAPPVSVPSPGVEPPRAQPKRIRPAPRRPKWRRSSRAPWFGLVLIALIAGVLNALGVGKTHSTSTSASRSPVVSTPSPRVVVPAVVAGWRSVAGTDGSYAYDVPPAWEPAPGTLHGWEKSGAIPGIRLIASAFLGRGFCPGHSGSVLGGAGVTTIAGDPDAAARQAVTDLGVSAFSPENGPLAAVTPEAGTDVEVPRASGTKLPGRIVVAEVVPSDTSECVAKHALVAALAFRGETDPGRSGVVVVYADADRSGPTVRDDVVRILRSYRFVAASDRSTTTPPPTTRR